MFLKIKSKKEVGQLSQMETIPKEEINYILQVKNCLNATKQVVKYFPKELSDTGIKEIIDGLEGQKIISIIRNKSSKKVKVVFTRPDHTLRLKALSCAYRLRVRL